MKRTIFIGIFIFIILSGFGLRFYKLGATPNSLNWDEVSWGYNGYSILKTGKDEYGNTMPLSFQAFGDYKQPVYVYLDAISIGLFGLTPFAVRFPSSLFGLLTLPFLFLLVRELLQKYQFRDETALACMGFFAISPWAIQFSRVAYEATVALFLVIAGFSLILYGQNRRSVWPMIVGTISLALSTFTYHSEKIIIPILFLAYFLLHLSLWKARKKLVGLLLILFIIIVSTWVVDPRTTARGRSVLFIAPSNQTRVLGNSVKKLEIASNNDALAKIIYNRRFIYLKTFTSNYLTHFDPKYLFLTGDDARHHAPSMGILYLFALPFILIGLYISLTRYRREFSFLFMWFLISPIGSAVTVNSPNASRNLMMAPIWDILAGIGLVFILSKLKQSKKIAMILICLVVLLFGNFLYYIHQYFVRTNFEVPSYWQYGYKEALIELSRLKQVYPHVFVADSVEQGYIFYLFYNRVDPESYFKRPGAAKVVSQCRVIDGIYFGSCSQKPVHGDLIVTTKGLIFPTNKIKTILDPSGETAVEYYRVK